MTALLTLMWKKANSNTMGKRSMPSVDIIKMKDFIHCIFFFLSKNTQSTMLYSRNFTVK